jgi:hypothetical protein
MEREGKKSREKGRDQERREEMDREGKRMNEKGRD